VFDVGFWELTFIMTLALLVLGPDKLPGLVRSLGRWMGRARSVARNLRVQIEREVADMPVTPSAKPRAAATPKQEPSDPVENTAGDGIAEKPDPAPSPDNHAAKNPDKHPDPNSDDAEPAGEKGSEPGIRF